MLMVMLPSRLPFSTARSLPANSPGPLVITIARQFGAGGDELARAVASLLGFPLLDREILARAASQAGVSEETIARCEHRQSMVEQIMERLALPYTGDFFDPLSSLPETLNFVSNHDYRRLIEHVVGQVADDQNAVIVGHAGQVVLRDRPSVFKVLVCAGMEDRIGRVMVTEEVSAAAAQRLIAERDRDVGELFQSVYHVDMLDARLYDLVINRSKLSEETALKLIVTAVQRRTVDDCGCA
jgi:cytidylate kinase